MSRPIDAVKAAEVLHEEFGIPFDEMVDAFGKIPTFEPPKARWSSTFINGKWRWTCSKCGHYCKHIKTGLPNWCEWCGADMREKGEQK